MYLIMISTFLGDMLRSMLWCASLYIGYAVGIQ